ncbi:MAG: prepilin-type cleavage/methylation domain-containing protein [Myxococcales bacterium]|nr:prepilin-type cleavage/methylation domain-containing protein [Myxococcales bacterium]
MVLAGLAYPAARAIAAERARAMTREARDNVDLLFHGTAAHFALARPRLGAAAHRCPHPKDHPEGGAIAITPPLTVRCADGPDGACTPSASDRPGAYDPALWNDPVWRGLGFRKLEGHRFHFAYEAVNLDDGYGACEFTVTARADLDGDGVYSTYRRSGRADQRGVRPTTPLVIDAPFE